jgi:hypothetical protein
MSTSEVDFTIYQEPQPCDDEDYYPLEDVFDAVSMLDSRSLQSLGELIEETIVRARVLRLTPHDTAQAVLNVLTGEDPGEVGTGWDSDTD